MGSGQLATRLWCWAMGIGLLALILPLIVARFKIRWAAGLAAGLSLAATILEYFSNGYVSGNADIRADIVLIVPLLAISWASCIGLILSAVFRKEGARGR